MNVINVEIKARCARPDGIRDVLRSRNARFEGKDHQVDTYFRVNKGRLKLREGNIENNLIYYRRENISGPKQSDCQLLSTRQDSQLKQILIDSMGILAVVDKQREIYYIDNLKIHIDEVKHLGSFMEIEASDERGNVTEDQLHEQCRELMQAMRIEEKDLESRSYSDLIMEFQKG